MQWAESSFATTNTIPPAPLAVNCSSARASWRSPRLDDSLHAGRERRVGTSVLHRGTSLVRKTSASRPQQASMDAIHGPPPGSMGEAEAAASRTAFRGKRQEGDNHYTTIARTHGGCVAGVSAEADFDPRSKFVPSSVLLRPVRAQHYGKSAVRLPHKRTCNSLSYRFFKLVAGAGFEPAAFRL